MVTARKRDEAFRDVPVTINVFTERAIEAAGITKPADYIRMVPNMNLVETQNVGNAFVVIRGISQARNSEPSVAVLIDGVAQTNPAQFNQELYDIQQIEVLKGPQGGLYGRNAIGGAILYTTRPPADEFEGSVTLGYGNESSYTAKGDISGPITDQLKYRASVSYYDTEGFLENEFLGTKADPVRNLAGRVRLLWEPNDVFTGDLRASYSKIDTKALYFVIPRADEANVFSIVSDANNTSTPITLDNPGTNEREMWNRGPQARLQRRRRDPDIDLFLRRYRRGSDGRCVRLSTGATVILLHVPAHRGRPRCGPEPEPVPRRPGL